MSDWHVRESTAHSGTRDGTSYATAWGTFSEITWGAGGVIAGDTLYVEGVHTTALAIGESGSAGSLITIRGDGDDEAGSIEGGGAIANCLTATAIDYIYILNINISGSGGGHVMQLYDGTDAGTDARYITVEGCILHDAQGGASNNNGIGAWGTNITIKNNTIYDVNYDGIKLKGSGHITGNTIYNTDLANAGGDCIQLYGDSTGTIVEYNDCDHTNNDLKQCIIGNGTGSDITIRFNTVTGYPDGTANSGIWLQGYSSGYVYGNTITGGYIGIQNIATNVLIYSNKISACTDTSGISCGSAAVSSKIFNNVVDGCSNGIATNAMIDDDCSIYNNIVMNSSANGLLLQANHTNGTNILWNNDTDSNLAIGTNIQSDPGLNSNYNPTSGSPSIGAGTFVSFSKDYAGNRFYVPPTIGAYEVNVPSQYLMIDYEEGPVIVSGGAPVDTLQFYAPLTSSLTLDTGAATPTFTRATVATVSDWEGLVNPVISGESRFQGARRVENLQIYSQDFGQANWVVTGSASIATGTTDPDGGSTAATVSFTARYEIFKDELIYESTGANFQRGMSIWMRISSGGGAYKISSTNGASLQSVTVTSSWQRFFVSQKRTNAGWTGTYIINDNTGSSALEIAYAQHEVIEGQSNQNPGEYVSVGVESSPYHGANVDGVQYFETENGNTVASNVVTEDTGDPLTTQDGVLIEEQRTNNCIYSADLSNAAWVASNITKSSDGVTLPDGTTGTAETLTASAGNGTLLQSITLAAAANTYSVYLQRKTGTGNIDITLDNGSTWTTKALTGAGTWDRVDIQGASAADPIVGVRIVTSGDAIQMTGAQLETGAFPTSLIPTTTVAVTRNADVLTYDYQPNALVGSMLLSKTFIGRGTGYAGLVSNSNCRYHYHTSSTDQRAYDGVTATQFVVATNALQNIGMTWEDGASPEVALYAAGSQGATGALAAGGFNPSSDPLGIGCQGSDDAQSLCGTYKEVKFYTDARTQAEMEADTT